MVVPRWEWRTFGDDLAEAEARLRKVPTERVGQSDETYLLSAVADASVKVRDGQMDVKRLDSVNDDGLELWRPVLKAGFPLADADVRTLTAALGVPDPAPAPGGYSLDDLLAFVRADPSLLALDVHKRREHYSFGGCRAEVTEVRTAHGSARTIAVEAEDPALVIAAVRELGLASRRNVSVPRGLKALVGFGARRYAVLDVGTNSVNFHIGERRADGEWRTIVDRAVITRLGEGLNETGRLGEEPMARTVDAIAGMADEARRDDVVEVAAVGTAGLRQAANSGAFLELVRERTGIEVEVISGEEEARLAYLAVETGLALGDGSLLVFDTGGGSSQFTFGESHRLTEQFSVNVGSVRLTEQFGLDGAVGEDVVSAALEATARELKALDDRVEPDAVVGLGGAVTNLTAVSLELDPYDPDRVQGARLELAEIERQIELYRTRTADERRAIVGLQPKRAEVILAGACIVRTVLAKAGRDALTVSDRGLRHGLLVARFG